MVSIHDIDNNLNSQGFGKSLIYGGWIPHPHPSYRNNNSRAGKNKTKKKLNNRKRYKKKSYKKLLKKNKFKNHYKYTRKIKLGKLNKAFFY